MGQHDSTTEGVRTTIQPLVLRDCQLRGCYTHKHCRRNQNVYATKPHTRKRSSTSSSNGRHEEPHFNKAAKTVEEDYYRNVYIYNEFSARTNTFKGKYNKSNGKGKYGKTKDREYHTLQQQRQRKRKIRITTVHCQTTRLTQRHRIIWIIQQHLERPSPASYNKGKGKGQGDGKGAYDNNYPQQQQKGKETKGKSNF
eukprot:5614602-Amphidinium_carterae.6